MLPPILFEDNHLIAVNKRPGDISQGDKTGDDPLGEIIKEYIREKYKKPGNVYLGVVHRLDRPVSGAILFARTSKAAERLAEMIRLKEIKKTYWAVVKNKPPQEKGTLTHYLVKKEAINRSYAYTHEVKNGKIAVLHYELVGATKNYYLLRIHLETGRHHQIRVQLSAIGCPVKGDVKYGAERTNDNGSIHLHARRLELLHPVKKEPLTILADPPDDPVWNEFVKLDAE